MLSMNAVVKNDVISSTRHPLDLFRALVRPGDVVACCERRRTEKWWRGLVEKKSHRKASLHVHCEWKKQEKVAAIDLGSFLGYLNSKYCMCLAFCTERHERSSALALRWKLMPMPCSLLFVSSFDLFLRIWVVRIITYLMSGCGVLNTSSRVWVFLMNHGQGYRAMVAFRFKSVLVLRTERKSTSKKSVGHYGPFQTSCYCRAELNSIQFIIYELSLARQ